jgi:hypothetical protein
MYEAQFRVLRLVAAFELSNESGDLSPHSKDCLQLQTAIEERNVKPLPKLARRLAELGVQMIRVQRLHLATLIYEDCESLNPLCAVRQDLILYGFFHKILTAQNMGALEDKLFHTRR